MAVLCKQNVFIMGIPIPHIKKFMCSKVLFNMQSHFYIRHF